MRTSRRVLHWSARGLTAAIGAAVAVATGLAVSLIPLPGITSPVPQADISPVPTEQTRVCPGPILALGVDVVDASRAVTIGPADTQFAAEGAEPAATPLTAAGALLQPGDGAPLALTVPVPSGATTPPAIGASQSQQVASDEVAGLAAVTCGEAVADSWLVGGSTKLGQTTVVLLANPTPVEASVDLTVYGEQGVVGDDPVRVTVAASSQLMVPLAGMASELGAPVVHVVATGGRVYATLQQNSITGITPGGVASVGPTAPPAATVHIPGVTVRGAETVLSEATAEGYPVTLPAVRVLAPGDDDANVRVSYAPAGGNGSATAWEGHLSAGTVTEVPLRDLADGDYTVTVTSAVPVVAAARVSTSDGTNRDFAWYTGASPLGPDTLLSVTGPATLHLANPGASPAAVTLTVADGTAPGSAAPGGTAPSGTAPDAAAQRVEVPAGGAVAVPLAHRGSYRLAGAGGLVASVGYSGGGTLASISVGSAGSLVAPLTVYPR